MRRISTRLDGQNSGFVQIEPVVPLNPADYPNRYATIPPNGRRCEFTGLGHAKLYQILGLNGVARRHVRVANLRTPGAARGQTLFHVGDMLRFLDELAATTAGEMGMGGEKCQLN